jgi:hypothetical protein
MALAGAGLGLLLLWSRGAVAIPSPLGIGLIAFVILAAAAFLRSLRRASQTVYALTSLRLIRFRRGRPAVESSIPLGEARPWRIRKHSDGTGDVLFGNGAAFNAVRDAQALESALEYQLARVPAVEDEERLPVPIWTAQAVAGVVCCVASPLFDPVGYVMTLVGLVLLWRRSGFSLHVRLAATAVVLPPRILPLLLSALAGPGDFSFVLNPHPPATSSSAWGWYGLLWAFCAVLLLIFTEKGAALLASAGLRRARSAPGGDSVRRERASILLVIPAALVLAWATKAVLGLNNEFEWVEAAPAGAWELKHSVRGTVATFTAETVAFIEGREEGHPDTPSYRIRFAFKNGNARVMSTRSLSAYGEMKQLAATMALPPGRMQLKSAAGEAWTNGRAGFTLKEYAGTYEAANGNFVELRLDQNGRLIGTESVLGSGGERLTRALWSVKITEDGGIEYRTDMFAGSVRNFAVSYGLSRGEFDKDGLTMDGTRFSKRSPGALGAPAQEPGHARPGK